jgi:4-hydroxy-2-oxoheptanedioate aldolase
MRQSLIISKLKRNVPALITTLHLADPSVFELASLMGFDGIWLDMEHHAHSMETAHNLMRAARVGRSDILARPAKGEFMRMARMLEAGAQGITSACRSTDTLGRPIRKRLWSFKSRNRKPLK